MRVQSVQGRERDSVKNVYFFTPLPHPTLTESSFLLYPDFPHQSTGQVSPLRNILPELFRFLSG